MAATELGDRRPYSGGNWLKTLRGLDATRIWWAATDAPEEYEDALLEGFAAGVADEERASLADPGTVLPFANLRRSTGARKATGITGALVAEPVEPVAPPTRFTDIPDGDADGARGEPPVTSNRARSPAPRPVAARRPALPLTSRASAGRAIAPRARTTAASRPEPVVEALTAEGAARLQAELEELTVVRRPEVIARIRTAKEHGDLKENAEYHAAREEQSFLEGRVQALEARLRGAPIVDAPAAGARVGLGSKVTVEHEGETMTYTIVGASDSDPASGRISSSSPVGRALIARDVGDDVAVVTPAGERRYRIVAIT
jgi:transcription elongation factor GreA